MKIEVLYISNCPNRKPAVERVHDALSNAGTSAIIQEVEVGTSADAKAMRFLGSPTVRINGLDVEPEARAARHFGLGCRSYTESGHRSGLPSVALTCECSSGHRPGCHRRGMGLRVCHRR
ncbi:DF family (seleno)protein [Edaphobacter sp.]|uniref:DF family (seleno)protein n=1 Tax=Edaphobacter sp. TaxID=1934404 RepID=UPI003BB8886D